MSCDSMSLGRCKFQARNRRRRAAVLTARFTAPELQFRGSIQDNVTRGAVSGRALEPYREA